LGKAKFPQAEDDEKNPLRSSSIVKTDAMPPMQRGEERYAALRRRRHSMSHALHPALQILIALSSLVLLIGPTIFVDEDDLDANDFDHPHLP
jgi:hypothetical protein